MNHCSRHDIHDAAGDPPPAAGRGKIPFRLCRPHGSNNANEYARIRSEAAEAADCRAPGQRETIRQTKVANAGHIRLAQPS